MRFFKGLGGGGLFVILGCCAGCSSTTSGLKARFARDHGCSTDQVAVVNENGVDYHASGCGKETDYVCGSTAGFGDSSHFCTVRGLNPHESTGEPPPQNALDNRPDLVGPK
jgi:hypothetical protein